MKILLLGATGRTGKLVLKQALERGYEVSCIVRNSEQVKNQNGLTIFEGNPGDTQLVEKAITGCSAVISVLNISRTSDFPWARLRTPDTFLSDVMRILIPIAEERNVKRVVICSAWGVSETKNDIPKWFRWFINNSNVGIAYKDHERQEKIISQSTLDWTIVRPAGLTNSDKAQTIQESYNNTPRPGLTVSRLSLAKYLVGCVESHGKIGKKVVVSKR